MHLSQWLCRLVHKLDGVGVGTSWGLSLMGADFTRVIQFAKLH